MRIDQTVHVPADIDRVWEFLGDVPAVAACMPGATLTGSVDGTTHEGQVRVAIGPLAMNYTGVVTIVERDEAARTVRLRASGRDRRGSGTAQADVTVRLASTDGGTRLRVASDLRLTGRVAALGRGVNDVAGRLFADFADRLSAELAGRPARPGQAPPEGPTGRVEPAPEPAGRVAPLPASRPGPEAAGRAAPAGEGRAAAGGGSSQIKVGSLLWSIARERVGAFLVRLGERVLP